MKKPRKDRKKMSAGMKGASHASATRTGKPPITLPRVKFLERGKTEKDDGRENPHSDT